MSLDEGNLPDDFASDQELVNELIVARAWDPVEHGVDSLEFLESQMDRIRAWVDGLELSHLFHVDYDQVALALNLAHLVHFNQKRSVSDKFYIHHPIESVKYYLDNKDEEYSIRNIPKLLGDKKVNLTEGIISILLHDTVEEIGEGVENQDTKERLDELLKSFILRHFREKISYFVSTVATKPSKRIHQIMPSCCDPVVARSSGQVQQVKEVRGRVDDLAIITAIENSLGDAEFLEWKGAERSQNLEDFDKLPGMERKILDAYNLALKYFMVGMRTPGKKMFEQTFRHSFGKDTALFDSFKEVITESQDSDRQLWEDLCEEHNIADQIEEALGHNRFAIQVKPLDLWRAHMDLSYQYQFFDNVNRDHPVEHIHFNPENTKRYTSDILDSEMMQKIIKDSFLSRVIIITETPEDAVNLIQQSFPPLRVIASTINIGECPLLKSGSSASQKVLMRSGYQSYRFSIEIPETEQFIEIKVVDQDMHANNEFGRVSYQENDEGNLIAFYDSSPLRQFIEEVEGQCDEEFFEGFEELRNALLDSEGSDLRPWGDLLRLINSVIRRLDMKELISTLGIEESERRLLFQMARYYDLFEDEFLEED